MHATAETHALCRSLRAPPSPPPPHSTPPPLPVLPCSPSPLRLAYVLCAGFREGSYSCDGRKLQLLQSDEYTPLGAPLRLFDFDFENDDVDTMCETRVAELACTCESDGLLTAFLVYFHLHCDADPTNHLSTGG